MGLQPPRSRDAPGDPMESGTTLTGLGPSKPGTLMLGPMGSGPKASSSLEMQFQPCSGVSSTIFLPATGQRETCGCVGWHPSPGKASCTNWELIACRFPTLALIPSLQFTLRSNCCVQKKETSHFVLSVLLTGRGFCVVFCFANISNECVNTSWHRFSSLLRLEFALLTRLPA